MSVTTLDSWIDGLQSRGRYAFLRAEAVRDSGLSAQSVERALRRAVRTGRLVRPKEYFFVITPIEYRSAGSPPVSWFIDALMNAMDLPYYAALLTAAAFHGAAHQTPIEFQVMTDRSVRPMVAGRTRIVLISSAHCGRAAITTVKTPTGSMRLSTPETTVVDLVRFARRAGGLDHVASVIGQMRGTLDARRLVAAARISDDIPNAQRLGHILDRTRQREIADALHTWVAPRIARPQLLRAGGVSDRARRDRRWELIVNGGLEIER